MRQKKSFWVTVNSNYKYETIISKISKKQMVFSDNCM